MGDVRIPGPSRMTSPEPWMLRNPTIHVQKIESAA
jgi:hypothetical protein